MGFLLCLVVWFMDWTVILPTLIPIPSLLCAVRFYPLWLFVERTTVTVALCCYYSFPVPFSSPFLPSSSQLPVPCLPLLTAFPYLPYLHMHVPYAAVSMTPMYCLVPCMYFCAYGVLSCHCCQRKRKQTNKLLFSQTLALGTHGVARALHDMACSMAGMQTGMAFTTTGMREAWQAALPAALWNTFGWEEDGDVSVCDSWALLLLLLFSCRGSASLACGVRRAALLACLYSCLSCTILHCHLLYSDMSLLYLLIGQGLSYYSFSLTEPVMCGVSEYLSVSVSAPPVSSEQ